MGNYYVKNNGRIFRKKKKSIWCKIGWHTWEEVPENTQNTGLALLCLVAFGRNYKCKYCGKRK